MTPGRLECQFFDHVAIVRLRDRYPDNDGVQQLREELRNLLADDAIRHVVLNFEGVDFFDANLRAVLVLTSRELAKRNGRLLLCSMPRAMRDHPSIVAFGQKLMTIVEGQDDAMRLLGRPRWRW